jgi:hypothetical protein
MVHAVGVEEHVDVQIREHAACRMLHLQAGKYVSKWTESDGSIASRSCLELKCIARRSVHPSSAWSITRRPTRRGPTRENLRTEGP